MEITMLIPSALRTDSGGAPRLAVEVADGAPLGAVLDALAASHPRLERRLRDESGALRRHVNLYVDGEECRRLAGADTVLAAGAELQVIASVAGG